MDTLTSSYAGTNPGEIVANIKIAQIRLNEQIDQLARTLNHRREVLSTPGAIARMESEADEALRAIGAINCAVLNGQEFIMHMAKAIERVPDQITPTKNVITRPAQPKVEGYVHRLLNNETYVKKRPCPDILPTGARDGET